MGQSTPIKFGEKELSALNARADAVSKRDASAWEEAVDWDVSEIAALCAPLSGEWRQRPSSIDLRAADPKRAARLRVAWLAPGAAEPQR